MVDYVQIPMPHSFSAKHVWEKRVMRGVQVLVGCWEQKEHRKNPA